MFAVATKTADSLLRESQPSFASNGIMDARSRHVRNDTSTEIVISTVCPVDPLPVVFGVVENLPIDFIAGSIDNKGVVEGGVVRVVVDGRLWISSSDGPDKK